MLTNKRFTALTMAALVAATLSTALPAASQTAPAERATVGPQRLVTVGPELLEHVADHAVVGGGGRAEHRHPRGQRREHVAHAPVVGTEVVSPVTNAVRFVHGKQRNIYRLKNF